jgi:putative transposase
MYAKAVMEAHGSRKHRLGRKPTAGRIVGIMVQRAFSAESRNVLWFRYIIYIPLQQGFLYLAAYIDINFSRKVVGWR